MLSAIFSTYLVTTGFSLRISSVNAIYEILNNLVIHLNNTKFPALAIYDGKIAIKEFLCQKYDKRGGISTRLVFLQKIG